MSKDEGLARRLRSARVGAKLGSKTAAEALGVTPQTLSAWEREGRGQSPRDHHLHRAASLYGVSPFWLKYGEHRPPGLADFDQPEVFQDLSPAPSLMLWRVVSQSMEWMWIRAKQFEMDGYPFAAKAEVLEELLERWRLLDYLGQQFERGVATIDVERDGVAVRETFVDLGEPTEIEARLRALHGLAVLNSRLFSAEYDLGERPNLDLSTPHAWPEQLGISELASFVSNNGRHPLGVSLRDSSGRTVSFIPTRFFPRALQI